MVEKLEINSWNYKIKFKQEDTINSALKRFISNPRRLRLKLIDDLRFLVITYY